MSLIKTTLAFIAFLFIAPVSFAQTDTTALSAILKQQNALLGKQYAFALYKDGKQVYKKETGGFTIKTVQEIEGGSHWLTTALVLAFVQEGKLSLDDKVSTYLPVFAKYGKGYITLRHCLTHNTGIDGGKALQKTSFASLEEEVDYFAERREIKTNPGTEFYYSNIGYKIAARVLEVVTKRKFERLMKEKITGPLAMRLTTFANDNTDKAPDPAGAKSAASEYLNFLSMLLNKGSFNGKQVLTEESVKTLLSIHAANATMKNTAKQAAGMDYAMGSWVAEKNGKDEPVVFMSLGSDDTHAVLDLCRGYAFVIFSNSTEVKKELCLQIKSAIDEGLKTGCH